MKATKERTVLTIPPMSSLLTRADEYTVTDMFAGGGGSSTGMAMIPGVRIVMAANHLQLAMDVHNLNHQDTDHATVDLHAEDPRFFSKTDILWASPECTKWSQANGADLPDIEADLFTDVDEASAANQSRLLMFDVLRYIEHHRYRRVIVENVVDIAVSAKYRNAWLEWRKKLLALGYEFEVVSLNSMHAQFGGLPAPQSRDRLYIIAWPKGDVKPDVAKVMRPKAWCPTCSEVIESQQAWKNGRTVGRYRAQYIYVDPKCGTAVEPAWLPAAAAIDWSIPGERIGDRKKPLEAKTRRRIAAGIARYWRPQVVEAAGNTYDAADPKHRSYGDPNGYYRSWPTEDVLRTLHTTESKALAVPVEGREGKVARPVEEVGRTQTTRAETALAQLPLVLDNNHHNRCREVSEALPTMTTATTKALIDPAPFIAELRGGERSSSDARAASDPLATVCASGNHHALVEPPFMLERRHEYRTRGIGDPLATLTANDTTKALITSAGGTWNDEARPVMEALRTLTTRDAYALLAPYYSGSEVAKTAIDALGTLTTRDRYALVQRMNGGGAEMLTPAQEEMRTLTTKGHQSLVTPGDVDAAEAMVDDCLFRMLRPHEVAVGMAFPRDYKWQPYDNKVVSNRDLVKMAGNAVTPPAARDLMYAVVESLDMETRRRRRKQPLRVDMAA